MFPVLNTEDGDGSIKEGEMIRRIPWVPTDPAGKAIVEKAVYEDKVIDGPDKQATRLWWDATTQNF